MKFDGVTIFFLLLFGLLGLFLFGMYRMEMRFDQEKIDCDKKNGIFITSRDGRWCVPDFPKNDNGIIDNQEKARIIWDHCVDYCGRGYSYDEIPSECWPEAWVCHVNQP